MSRPEILFRYFEPVRNLKGVGDRMAKKLEKMGLARIRDMLFDPPEKLIERVNPEGSLMAYLGRQPILEGEVGEHQAPRRSNMPYRVRFHTNWGDVDLVYFKAQAKWLGELLPMGESRFVSGKLEEYQGQFQIAHPEFVTENREEIPKFEAQYGLTEGVSQKQMQKFMGEALAYASPLPEWLREDVLKAQNWTDWAQALRVLHHPQSPADLSLQSAARTRLAYDELLSHQLALALARAKRKTPRGRVLALDEELMARAKAQLPYALTSAQARAVDEIVADFSSEKRMFRMVQGDVGAGKTAVAYLAMTAQAGAGLQSALMAPTEILARQHFASLKGLFAGLGFQPVLLTGSDSARERQTKLAALASGEAMIAIGTHALFQKSVEFFKLGLSVVDEQHRFGVGQRAELTAKGEAVDLLAMSATPIPRSLAMTIYGEMDLSVLDEKPAGRSAVQTSVMSLARLDALVDRIKTAIKSEGRQAYWVCPLVEESEVLEFTAAKARYNDLRQRLPDLNIGLLHGQMPSEEKDAVMRDFASGGVQLLVATTVIEVGVDVPNASIMAIEGAERFGLSQLHQLRGRVGRGQAQSFCILIYAGHLSEASRERLEMMRETEDGFEIAEADMRLRGAGDLLGRAQSGLPRFQLADWEAHGDLVLMAQDDARLVVDQDPELQTKRGEALRILLYLQEREQSVAILRKS